MSSLAQQIVAARERPEELVVEVVAIRQHDDRGIGHRRVQDDPPRVEAIVRLLPEPWVCQMMPPRWSRSAPVSFDRPLSSRSTALCTARNC